MRLVYQRLRRRGADPLTLVFASFGLALVLRNLLLLLFGPDPHNYSTEIQMAVRLPGNVLVLPDQMLVFGITLLVLAAAVGLPALHPPGHRDALGGRESGPGRHRRHRHHGHRAR